MALPDRIAVMVTTQRPLPLQPPPLHPLKTAPGPALAVRVTIAPPVKSCAQLEPQAIPCGALVTVPLAEPRRVTASANRPGGAVNVAVTVVAVVRVTEQVPVPLQAPPLQPANVEPGSGVATSWSAVPLLRTREHTPPHEMPAGLATSPLPVPSFVTVSRTGTTSKVAVTVLVAVTATVHRAPATVSHPRQPENVEVEAGFAVNTTLVPVANRAEQTEPQSIPAGALVTVPEPRPALTTETASDGTIVSVSAFEAPPPGGGLRTVTLAVPAAAISLAEIVARSCVRLTNVVGRLAPFHWITELETKLAPLAVRRKPGAPAATVLGRSEASEGAGDRSPNGVSVTHSGPAGEPPKLSTPVLGPPRAPEESVMMLPWPSSK